MNEEIDINIGTGRDSISGIEEKEGCVVVNYNSKGQTRPIVVPNKVIVFVKNVIEQMEVGERYTSLYVYNKCIKEFKIASNIISERLPILKDKLIKRGMKPIEADWIIEELMEDPEFIGITFKELIGTRKVKDSWYFKIYASIRYWSEKGVIDYNSKGSIYRVL